MVNMTKINDVVDLIKKELNVKFIFAADLSEYMNWQNLTRSFRTSLVKNGNVRWRFRKIKCQ